MTSTATRMDLTDQLLTDLDGFEQAADPTQTKVGEIVHRADEEMPVNLGISEKTGPGWVTIYATTNGEPRTINATQLEATMKKVNNDPSYPKVLGKPAFSRTPTMRYKLGTHKCRLHPSRTAERELYDSWGLAVCTSEHFPSEYEVTRHMQMDHKQEWAAIKDHEDEQRRRTEREEQNSILRLLVERTNPVPVQGVTVSSGTGQTVAVSYPPEPSHVRVQRRRRNNGAGAVKACSQCDFEANAVNAGAAASKLSRHIKQAHPE